MHQSGGWLLAGALLLGGCQPAAGPDDVRQDLRSWTASVRLAAQAWLRRDVSGPYLQQVTRAAGEALNDLKSGPLGAQVSRAAATVQAVERAARRDDRAAVRAALGQLP